MSTSCSGELTIKALKGERRQIKMEEMRKRNHIKVNRKEKVNKTGEQNKMQSDSGKVEKEKENNSYNTEEVNGKKKNREK